MFLIVIYINLIYLTMIVKKTKNPENSINKKNNAKHNSDYHRNIHKHIGENQ
jgi:hypothetical protein